MSEITIIQKSDNGVGFKEVNKDVFETLNRLSELDTEQKKIDARQNLGVQIFDCGEFF